jgi:hypothetical protein
MPLILAVEPDRRQSSKLTILARNQLHVELVVATSVDQALAHIDEQIPDLVLTSPLIPAKDALALSDRLRELDAEGLRVQTVTIPVLTVPGQRLRQPPKGGAVPARARSLSQVAAGGCDPVVFGMQLSAHLERAAADGSAERAAARSRQHREPAAPARRPAPPEEALPAAMALVEDEEDAPDAALELVEPASACAQEMSAEESEPEDLRVDDWSDILNAMRRDIEQTRTSAQQALEIMAQDGGADTAERLETLTLSLPRMDAPEDAAMPVSASDAGAADQATGEGKATPRKKRRKPRQDEWGFFDPDRCGVSALISKVNENAGKPGTPSKKTS